jgi:hypothetical protein
LIVLAINTAIELSRGEKADVFPISKESEELVFLKKSQNVYLKAWQ